MSNVIPQIGRAAVRRMYRTRFLLALSAAIFAVAFLATLSVLPSYLALRAVPLPTAAPRVSGDGSDRADIGRAQTLLSALESMNPSTTTPSALLALVLGARGSGVRVEHVTYTAATANKNGIVMLSGSADTPAKLDAYRKTLAESGRFANVTVPVGDLVGAQGGHFSMTLEGAF